MNFDIELQQRTGEIEALLSKFLPKEEGMHNTLMKAMNYSLIAGGKRLRPMLMEETFRLFEGKDKNLLEPFMAAVEMIHTYSLVHDDLPSMDNDEYRRGRKTTHVVYGEAMALLAGDGLLNYAYETAVGAYKRIYKDKPINDPMDELNAYKRVLRALEILGAKAGIHGMIGGQVIDMEGNQNNVDKNRLDLMYRLKTSALIEASMMIGAVLAGADEQAVNQVEAIASDIGLAFQIRDDILDITSNMEVLGKPVHSDEKNEKITYVSLMELEQAKEAVNRISNRALKAYEALAYHNEYLETLIRKLVTREK